MKPSSEWPPSIRHASAARLVFSIVFGALMQSPISLPAADEPKGPRPNVPPEQMFQRMDTNRDGKVSREEYDNAMRFAPRYRDNPQQAQVIFRQLDTDGDGSLSVQEFGRVAAMAGRGPGGGTP
ncbi:MAG TPA: EF-hand domain-containing protein [Roseimicrobium sp.]|nr:EF-hand domain-containing protein [Roseimicrobium sp.]